MSKFRTGQSIGYEPYTANVPLEELEEENPTVNLGYN